MVQETLSRATSLTLAAVVMLIYAFIDVAPEDVGIMQGVRFCNRLTYSFFHASFLHAFMNVWCLLSVAFVYPISIWSLIIAFGIAVSVPVDTFACTIPTIGLSGVCFALMGRISFMVRRKWSYQAWLWFYILLGLLFPNTNGWLHLYCYILGVLIGFLNKPLKC